MKPDGANEGKPVGSEFDGSWWDLLRLRQGRFGLAFTKDYKTLTADDSLSSGRLPKPWPPPRRRLDSSDTKAHPGFRDATDRRRPSLGRLPVADVVAGGPNRELPSTKPWRPYLNRTDRSVGELVLGWPDLLTHHQGSGLALKVNIWLAANVDPDPPDHTACEPMRCRAGVVIGNRLSAFSSDTEPFLADHELVRLSLDPTFSYLLLSVVQREHPRRHAWRVLSVLVERRGKEKALADRHVIGRYHLLLEAADEVVGVVEPVVLHVQSVPSLVRCE